ncbi:GFA family protein [uncultured Pseudomonas sp.]|uniref:GFA family protein n=1 Tax=uncultured Pseudomonas sp. TaxID=114707 RepID=UPI0025F816F2|nr:GFA family protein [uncultured Pseudomonas sp.]
MSLLLERHGQCLCGAVQLDCRLDNTDVSACHCQTCRRWGGGPLLAVECAQPPVIGGGDALGIHASSDWAERGFCIHCGTHLFYRLKAEPHYAIPVGLLEGEDWTLASEVFIEEKPAWYCFANQTRQLTGAELFAEHGQPDDV